MAFKAFLETKGRKTGKTHKVELLVVQYNNKFYFSRRNPGKANLVTDILLNKKICQLKYKDEKRANEERLVLEVNCN